MLRAFNLTAVPITLALLAACVEVSQPVVPPDPEQARREAEEQRAYAPVSEAPASMYAARVDGGFALAAVDPATMNPEHIRQTVDYQTDELPGSIIVDQQARFLYFVLPEGKAIRYAVGVGPAALGFDGGDAVIDRKGIWPRWTPTASMVERNPGHYGKFKDGVPGGIANPMGARALYMQKDGHDTYYRVHGTNDPKSIGRAVSAGCIRMLNQDVIDLHARVKTGAKILVL
ncbi:L,D-transpeptidase [Pseudogemmobacter faecipullorum]